MKLTLEEILKKTDLNILDIQRAGCVVFHMPAECQGEVASQFIDKLKGWAEQLGVNILVLPKEVQISAIPRESVTDSNIHVRVEALEKQFEAVLNNLKDEMVLVENEPTPTVSVKSE